MACDRQQSCTAHNNNNSESFKLEHVQNGLSELQRVHRDNLWQRQSSLDQSTLCTHSADLPHVPKMLGCGPSMVGEGSSLNAKKQVARCPGSYQIRGGWLVLVLGGFVRCPNLLLIHHSSLRSITPSFFIANNHSVFLCQNEVLCMKNIVFTSVSVKVGNYL